MIRFVCECGHHVRADESCAGRKAKCPKCGKVLVIPHESEVIVDNSDTFHHSEAPQPSINLAPTTVPDRFVSDNVPNSAPLALAEREKTCPYCGEKIKTDARKCKHCGEFITKEDYFVNHAIANNSGFNPMNSGGGYGNSGIAGAHQQYCPSCGKTISDNAMMCPFCGFAKRKSESKDNTTSLVVWGWIGALFFPILGVILGIVLMTKQRVGHGVSILIVSIIGWLITWAMFL
jgi:predicted nucleic acid-binding Zn ribbon protein